MRRATVRERVRMKRTGFRQNLAEGEGGAAQLRSYDEVRRVPLLR